MLREADGLSISSRIGYLDATQRRQAKALYRSLMRVQSLASQGETDSAALIAAAKQLIAAEPGIRLDYFEIVDGETLDPLENAGNGALVAVAAYVGATRLIDNLVLARRS